jgi:hypothetical protein
MSTAARRDTRGRRWLALAAVLLAATLSLTAQTGTDVTPPPVDEAALAARLFDMTRPAPGERAIIVYDPAYYPGITARLRDALHQRGVQTYVLVEDSPSMIATYLDRSPEAERRERDIVTSLRPLFRAADIFYWMPSRGYADDLRWERLVADSRVRSVHFHWMLRFPGARTAAEIAEQSRGIERRSLDIDLAAHAARQRALGRAMQGTTLRITTPAGTDLTIRVPRDQWFHFGDGDASRARASTARSIRDRQIELPVGMFNFVPAADGVEGTLSAPAIAQAGDAVADATLRLRKGRVVEVRAGTGEAWIRNRMREVGPDGDRIGTLFTNTHPQVPPHGLVIDIGANWENGGRNRARGMSRMTIRLTDATLTADGRTLMKDGRIDWEALGK